jgi:N12 class adenine-specific DNA methylase
VEAKLKKLQDDSRKDDVISFEQLGVDRLYVDEAHAFKNRAKRCA